MTNKVEKALETLRQQSDGVPVHERLEQLKGMRQLTEVLIEAGVEFPAIIHGFIYRERERLSCPRPTQSEALYLQRLSRVPRKKPTE